MEVATETVYYNKHTGEVYGQYNNTQQKKLWRDGVGCILKPNCNHVKLYQNAF